MPPTHLTPVTPPSNLPKPPGKVAQFQQLATVQKDPPRTSCRCSHLPQSTPRGEGVVGCSTALSTRPTPS
jgi:hypothetical protein